MKSTLPYQSLTYSQTKLKPLLKKQFELNGSTSLNIQENVEILLNEPVSASVQRAYDVRTRKVRNQNLAHSLQPTDFKELPTKDEDLLKQLKQEKLKTFQDLWRFEDNYQRKYGIRARFDQLENLNIKATQTCRDITYHIQEGLKLEHKLTHLLNSLNSISEFEPLPSLDLDFSILSSSAYPKYNELLFSGDLHFKQHIVSVSLYMNRMVGSYSLQLSMCSKVQMFSEEDYLYEFMLLKRLEFYELERYNKTVLSSLELRYVVLRLLQNSKKFRNFIPL